MISDVVFERGLALLRTLPGSERLSNSSVIAIWNEYLEEYLDDASFTEAIKMAIIKCRFLPTAEELVGFVTGGLEAKAIQEWQVVLSASRLPTEEHQNHIAYISNRGRVALQAVGGLEAIGLADEKQRIWIEKNFKTVYQQTSEKDAHCLPPAKIQHQSQIQKCDAEDFTPEQQIENLQKLREMMKTVIR